jgi:hypothetical protein
MQACACLGGQPGGVEIVRVWIASLASLQGVAQQTGNHAGLCRTEGHGLTEGILCRPVQAWEAWPGRAEIMCVWIPCLAGLSGAGLWSGYHAGLCRPGGRSLAERRSCMCGLLAWQALGTWPGRVEIMEAYTGLRAWPGRDCECLWISGLAGLEGWSSGDCVELRGGSLG